jgi:hypothetical protein
MDGTFPLGNKYCHCYLLGNLQLGRINSLPLRSVSKIEFIYSGKRMRDKLLLEIQRILRTRKELLLLY